MRKTVPKTTKQLIMGYLNNRSWCSGMQLENQAQAWQTKASTISRRARELTDEGKLERKLGDKRTVQYRVKTDLAHAITPKTTTVSNTTLFNMAKEKKDFARW